MKHNEHLNALKSQEEQLNTMSIYQLTSLHRSVSRLFDAMGAEGERPCFENGRAGDFLNTLWEYMGSLLTNVTDALVNQTPLDADDAEMKARTLIAYDVEGEDLNNMVARVSLAIQSINAMRSHAHTGSEV